MNDIEKVYAETLYRLVRGAFLAGAVVGLGFSVAALADVLLDLHWSLGSETIWGGVLFAVVSWACSRFIEKVAHQVFRLRR